MKSYTLPFFVGLSRSETTEKSNRLSFWIFQERRYHTLKVSLLADLQRKDIIKYGLT